MINPNKTHRAKGTLESIGSVESKVKLLNGHVLTAWTSDLPKNARIGMPVNIQAQYSICLDQYVCKTVRTRKIA